MIREENENSKLIISDLGHDEEIRISTISPSGICSGIFINKEIAKKIINHLNMQYGFNKENK